VQRTAGIQCDLQAFSWLEVFSALRLLSAPAPRPPLTQTVETVEKVPFQKKILKSGTETLKSAQFFVF